MACSSMTGGKLDPYPYVVNLRDRVPFYAVTIAFYAFLAAVAGTASFAMTRVSARSAIRFTGSE
jgi:hypothetical protein